MAPVPNVPIHFMNHAFSKSPTAPPQLKIEPCVTKDNKVLKTVTPAITYRRFLFKEYIFFPVIRLTPKTKKKLHNK